MLQIRALRRFQIKEKISASKLIFFYYELLQMQNYSIFKDYYNFKNKNFIISA